MPFIKEIVIVLSILLALSMGGNALLGRAYLHGVSELVKVDRDKESAQAQVNGCQKQLDIQNAAAKEYKKTADAAQAASKSAQRDAAKVRADYAQRLYGLTSDPIGPTSQDAMDWLRNKAQEVR